MKTLTTSLCLLIAFTLSACGWHLRGSVADDANGNARGAPIHLKISGTDTHGPLVTNLRLQFHAFNVSESDEDTASTFHLDLKDLKLDKRAAGVGTDALVNMYEIILSVNYQISRDDQVLTSSSTRATVSRTYNFEVNQVNYSEQEEALVMREMYRDLAQQILRRLKVLNNK
jgi:LPS-assembly lipoprotein